MSERAHEVEVLAWVNDVRVTHGIGNPLDALPPDADGHGLPSQSCVIVAALGTSCGYESVRVNDTEVTTPEYVRQFMHEHDARVYWAY